MPNRRRRSGKTYVNPTVAAAGSAQGDATPVFEGFTAVSGANGTKGVILTNGRVGDSFKIKGTTSGVLKVYPPSGAAINGLSANGAMSLASGLIPAEFFMASATQFYSLPLVPS